MSALGYAKTPARLTRTAEELRIVREAAIRVLSTFKLGDVFSGFELKAKSADPLLMERVLKMLERHNCVKRTAGGMSVIVSCDANRIRNHVQLQSKDIENT